MTTTSAPKATAVRRRLQVNWRTALLLLYAAAVLVALMLYQVCAGDPADPARQSCRPLSWSDPPVAFMVVIGAVIVGVRVTSFAFKGSKVELGDSEVLPLISTGRGVTPSAESQLDESIIGLMLLGTASELIQLDSFLFVFYEVVGDRIGRYWYTSSQIAQRAEASLNGIAGSRALMDKALQAFGKDHLEQDFVTPNPEQNLYLRFCLTAPVHSSTGNGLGVLMAVAAHEDQVRIGPNILSNHLQKCADALGSALS